MKQCMGGWCVRREKCPHYWAPKSSQEPSQRLCVSGRDGVRLVDASPFRVVEVDVFSGSRVSDSRAVEVE